MMHKILRIAPQNETLNRKGHVVYKTLQRATQNDMNYRVSYMLHKISWIQNETLSSKSQVIHKTLQKSTKIEIPIGWGTCCIRI